MWNMTEMQLFLHFLFPPPFHEGGMRVVPFERAKFEPLFPGVSFALRSRPRLPTACSTVALQSRDAVPCYAKDI